MKTRRIHRTRPGRWLVRHGPDWFAPRDELTGTYSRLALSRVRPDSCLALADVVDMKRINDVDWFAGGQLALAAVGARLRSLPAVRVYRFAGDEFLIETGVLTDEADARAFGDRVASTMDDPVDGISSPVRLRVTVDSDPVGCDPETAVRRLDERSWGKGRGDGVLVVGGRRQTA